MRTHSSSPARALLAGLALGAWLVPAGAHAQMTMTIDAYGTPARAWSSTNGSTTFFVDRPIGIDECTSTATMTLNFNGVPITTGLSTTYIDVWQASGSTDCRLGAERNSSATTPPCTRIAWTAMTTSPTYSTTMLPADLVDCTAASGRWTFYFLAVESSGDLTTDVSADASVTLDVAYWGTAPSAPTITAGAGDTTASVGVTVPTGTNRLYGVNVYVDPSGCGAGSDGGTSTLVPGAAPSGTPTSTAMSTNPTSVGVDVSTLAYGQSVAVAVTLVDLAQNESVLSNVVCVQRVEVDGFWDTYCAGTGLTADECRARYSGCSCTVAGASHRAPLGLGLLGLALAGVLYRRRRT